MDSDLHIPPDHYQGWIPSPRKKPNKQHFSRPQPDADLDTSQHETLGAFVRQGSSRYSISKRQKSKRAQRALAKLTRAGIKLDTNVSRHRGTAPRQLSSAHVAPSSLGSSGYSTRTKSLRGGGKHTSQEGLLIHISPSDRLVPIGIEVSESQAEAHMQSATSPSNRLHIDLAPGTPTILITPARETAEWTFDDMPGGSSRPRAPSSIYSRPTTFMPATQSARVPPVPSIPNHYNEHFDKSFAKTGMPEVRATSNRDSTMTTFEEDAEARGRARKDSNATLFEEDERRQSSFGARRHSRRGQDLSIETSLPTPQRSTGWWNYITTPFEHVKSPFFKSRSPISATDGAPPVPAVPYAAPVTGMRARSHSDGKSDRDSLKSDCSDFTEFSPSANIYNHRPVAENLLRNETALHNTQSTGSSVKQTFIDPAKHDRNSTLQQGRGYQQASRFSLVSPDEREVPIMLDSDVESLATSPQPFKQTPPPVHGPERRVNTQSPNAAQRMQPSAADHVTSPMSSDVAFSPGIVGVAAMAPMVTARTVETVPPAPIQNNLYFPPPPQAPHAAYIPPVSATTGVQAHPTYAHHTFEIHLNDNRQPVVHERYGKAGFNRLGSFQIDEKSTGSRYGWFSCLKRHKPKQKKTDVKQKKRSRKRCCCICCIFFVFIIIIIIIIALAVTLTHKSKTSTRESSSNNMTTVLWLNFTGFPGVPTGVVTIAQPDLRYSQSGCATPSTMWSCAVPKEQQSALAPNSPDQPNFRFQIMQNSSTAISSPSPPSLDEQNFLGNTTDKNALPFQGDETPFLISFLPTTESTPSRIKKRVPASASTTTSFPDLINLIPNPAVDADGRAAAANLLPFPTAQPLRIFNKGLSTEHYGFYSYFDRSIFLKNRALADNNSTDFSNIPADENGGSSIDSATVRCTWAQTRFLVQIWTNMANGTHLLPAPAANASQTSSKSVTLIRPGTFPYPVSITLDRHGGDTSKKMLYCYGMDDSGRIINSEKKLTLENKNFGGVAVNPTLGPFDNVTVSPKLGGPGGIDGGSGGCGCRWENFLRS